MKCICYVSKFPLVQTFLNQFNSGADPGFFLGEGASLKQRSLFPYSSSQRKQKEQNPLPAGKWKTDYSVKNP